MGVILLEYMLIDVDIGVMIMVVVIYVDGNGNIEIFILGVISFVIIVNIVFVVNGE